MLSRGAQTSTAPLRRDTTQNLLQATVMIRRILVVLILVLSPMLAFSQVESLVQQADSLYELHEEKAALQVYNRILEQSPDHYRALWRNSFLHSRIGNRQEGSSEQREYFNKARTLAERALEVDSTDAESNFVMAVAMGRMALISGARDRVAASREIRKYAQKALEYDPNHAGALHVLGRWHFKVANLSFVERLAANTLFGGIPGPASNERAAELIEKAISIDGDVLLYYYDLATVYEEMGQDEQAISTCQEALDKPSQFFDDEMNKQKCRDLIEDIR